MCYRKLYLLICFILIRLTTVGQISYENLKTALVLRFAENITWPNEQALKEFNIGFYGTDSAMFNALIRLKPIAEIKNKKFRVSKVSSLENIPNIQILYADESKSSDLAYIFKKIEKKSILLITEQSKDSKNVMLNILYDEKNKSISFEMNKANIVIENLLIEPKLLLLGGTEIDVRELYKEMKKQLELEKNEVEQQRQLVANQFKEISAQKEQIEVHKSRINELNKNAEVLHQRIEHRENELNQLEQDISLQQKSQRIQKKQIDDQLEQLLLQEKQLMSQKQLIKIESDKLDSLATESGKQQSVIDEQIAILGTKEQVIDLQSRLIYLFVAFLVVLLVLSVVVFIAYRNKRVLSDKLEDSNEILNKQHNAILQLNEELKTMNEALEDRVKERTQVLQERNEQLTEYAFINSHLLRAPLSRILGLSHLIIKENIAIKDRKIVEALNDSTEEMDKIIRKISDLLGKGYDFDRKEIMDSINRKFRNGSDKDDIQDPK